MEMEEMEVENESTPFKIYERCWIIVLMTCNKKEISFWRNAWNFQKCTHWDFQIVLENIHSRQTCELSRV